MTDPLGSAACAAQERQAIAALEQGRLTESLASWRRLLLIDPNHRLALTQAGQLAFRLSDFEAARRDFQRVATLDGKQPRQWINVALACQRLHDDAAEEAALAAALSLDPYDLLALLLRGALYERQGKAQQAAAAFGAAATVAPPPDQLAPELRPMLSRALQYRDEHQRRFADFIDRSLETQFGDVAGEDLARFRLSLDILLGRKRRFDAQPMQYFVPELAPVEFFKRRQFPWLDAIEAGTDAIRDEFLAVLQADDDSFVPYITYSADQPVAAWAELNHSPNWSALHLVQSGVPVAANAGRCPRTMALWRQVPSPQQPGRTPVALFSLLKPRTRIPPHVGASNARLVTHLPLIVPPGCGLRVGNTRREWVPGRAWVFDDTIEHEAWNDSNQLRVVLIFDIWHPALSPAERRMIGALSGALDAFNGSGATGYEV